MSTDRQNPYQSPRESTPDAHTVEHYAIDVRRLTVAECRRLSLNWVQVGTVLSFKLFRLPLPVTSATSTELVPIDADRLPETVRDKFHPLADSILSEGFRYDFSYTVPHLGNADEYGTAFRLIDGQAGAVFSHVRAWQDSTCIEKCRTSLLTLLTDGTILVTTNSPPEIDPPKFLQVERIIGAPMNKLVERHRLRIRESNIPPNSWHSAQEFLEFLRFRELHLMRYYEARGLAKRITVQKFHELQDRAQPPPRSPTNVSRSVAIVQSVLFLSFIMLLCVRLVGPRLTPRQSSLYIGALVLTVIGLAATVIWGLISANSRSRGERG